MNSVAEFCARLVIAAGWLLLAILLGFLILPFVPFFLFGRAQCKKLIG